MLKIFWASISSKMWKNLSKVWGIDMELDEFGAIWIAKKNSDGENPAWADLSNRMSKIDLVFEEIDSDSAIENVVKLFLLMKMNHIFTNQPLSNWIPVY